MTIFVWENWSKNKTKHNKKPLITALASPPPPLLFLFLKTLPLLKLWIFCFESKILKAICERTQAPEGGNKQVLVFICVSLEVVANMSENWVCSTYTRLSKQRVSASVALL